MEHTSYELSKRLHDKGFRAQHKHKHAIPKGTHHKPAVIRIEQTSWMEYYKSFDLDIPAYTFTDLWNVLPDTLIHDEEFVFLCCQKVHENTGLMSCASYLKLDGIHNGQPSFRKTSPAEAVGLLVEWLLDNGHKVKSE